MRMVDVEARNQCVLCICSHQPEYEFLGIIICGATPAPIIFGIRKLQIAIYQQVIKNSTMVIPLDISDRKGI